MSDILNEVIDQENNEKVYKLSTFFIKIIIIIGIFAILVAIFFSWQKNEKIEIAKQDSDDLMNALHKINWDNKESIESTIADINKIADADKSAYAIFARLYIGMIESITNSSSRCIIEYKKIANNTKYDKTLRDFVWFSAISGELKYDLIKPQEAIKELEKFDNSNKPFYASASILHAILLSEIGKTDEAYSLAKKIADDKTIGVSKINNIADKIRIYFKYNKDFTKNTDSQTNNRNIQSEKR